MAGHTLLDRVIRNIWGIYPTSCCSKALPHDRSVLLQSAIKMLQHKLWSHRRDCMGTGNANAVNNQRVTVISQKIICYGCGNQGHYKRDCPERKNQSHKNQIEAFHIDLVPGAAPVATGTSINWRTSEMKELSEPLKELSGYRFIRPVPHLWGAPVLIDDLLISSKGSSGLLKNQTPKIYSPRTQAMNTKSIRDNIGVVDEAELYA
ncbi:putative reverse transcriptase domain-containing protein [Tanacetum coccineum]|uniref:Reverse transcriptase domain-containing protein n=1 Tax=Tanacetum coccineum TaxID=301880 RepID=A0ABQ4WMY2_9ASTR